MADIKSVRERSMNMARIRSKDTGPEVWFRKLLFSEGYRYRKNEGSIPGHPDIWLPGRRTAIFVHGCFWHRHAGCKYAYMPKSRVDFWNRKFENNMQRDEEVHEILKQQGIRQLVVWECTIHKMQRSPDVCSKILQIVEDFLESELPELEL